MKLWCKLFHRRYWLSNDWGTWWTSWDIHKGRFEIVCQKCGKVHEGQHER